MLGSAPALLAARANCCCLRRSCCVSGGRGISWNPMTTRTSRGSIGARCVSHFSSVWSGRSEIELSRYRPGIPTVMCEIRVVGSKADGEVAKGGKVLIVKETYILIANTVRAANRCTFTSLHSRTCSDLTAVQIEPLHIHQLSVQPDIRNATKQRMLLLLCLSCSLSHQSCASL